MDTGKGYVSLAMEMGVRTQGRGTLAWLWGICAMDIGKGYVCHNVVSGGFYGTGNGTTQRSLLEYCLAQTFIALAQTLCTHSRYFIHKRLSKSMQICTSKKHARQ